MDHITPVIIASVLVLLLAESARLWDEKRRRRRLGPRREPEPPEKLPTEQIEEISDESEDADDNGSDSEDEEELLAVSLLLMTRTNSLLTGNQLKLEKGLCTLVLDFAQSVRQPGRTNARAIVARRCLPIRADETTQALLRMRGEQEECERVLVLQRRATMKEGEGRMLAEKSLEAESKLRQAAEDTVKLYQMEMRRLKDFAVNREKDARALQAQLDSLKSELASLRNSVLDNSKEPDVRPYVERLVQEKEKLTLENHNLRTKYLMKKRELNEQRRRAAEQEVAAAHLDHQQRLLLASASSASNAGASASTTSSLLGSVPSLSTAAAHFAEFSDSLRDDLDPLPSPFTTPPASPSRGRATPALPVHPAAAGLHPLALVSALSQAVAAAAANSTATTTATTSTAVGLGGPPPPADPSTPKPQAGPVVVTAGPNRAQHLANALESPVTTTSSTGASSAGTKDSPILPPTPPVLPAPNTPLPSTSGSAGTVAFNTPSSPTVASLSSAPSTSSGVFGTDHKAAGGSTSSGLPSSSSIGHRSGATTNGRVLSIAGSVSAAVVGVNNAAGPTRQIEAAVACT